MPAGDFKLSGVKNASSASICAGVLGTYAGFARAADSWPFSTGSVDSVGKLASVIGALGFAGSCCGAGRC